MSLKDGLRELYHFIPQFVRIGRKYHALYKKYSELQYLPYEQRLAYQLQELQHIVSYAYDHTRYYHNLFDECGVDPYNIRDFSDIRKIPLLTKDIVQNNLADMVSDMIPPKQLQYVTTGGSTGKTLGFYITADTDRRRLAFEWIHWKAMGYEMGMPCAVLRGAVVKDGWFFYNRGENQLIMSTYDMLEENMDTYLEKLVEFSPRILRGYPSALTILSNYMVKNNFNPDRLRSIQAISTSSEVLLAEQKEIIERAFNCPVYDKYGNCEQVGVIGMCRERHYHEFMEHSYLEYLKDDGTPAKDGEFGEIIGTSFINEAVPFIRYQTGDRALLDIGHHCVCGVESRIIERMEGRTGDSLITKYGNLISITALNSHNDIFDHAKRIQYYQDEKGVVILKIVPRSDYTEEDSKKIYAELSEKFKDQVELRLEFVDSIPLTSRGKYKYLDQRLKL